MPNYAMITAVGRNRPGIAAALTGVLLEADCNIEDSQMAQLGPDFACMLMVRMPEGLVTRQLSSQFDQDAVVQALGMQVHLSALSPEEAADPRPDYLKFRIRVHGADHKGIVHAITKHLADQSANITNLHTEVIQGEPPLYVMTIEVELPPFVDSTKLTRQLADIGRQQNLEVAAEPWSVEKKF